MGENEYINPPVKDGDEIDVTIEAVGKKGDGIAKIQGYTIFVPDAQLDEQIKVRITKAKDKFAFAEIISDKPSEDTESQDTENF